MVNIRIREDPTMYDYQAHVTWQQHDRRLAAEAERRRMNLEAVERSRAEAEPADAPEVVIDAATPVQASTRVATSTAC